MYRNSTTYQENQVPKLDFWSNSYRYGFNGMEKDDEVKGSGNSYDFGARMYDSRLGRFLSIDPKANELNFLSPYCFAANIPIKLIDLHGEGPNDPIDEKIASKQGLIIILAEAQDIESCVDDKYMREHADNWDYLMVKSLEDAEYYLAKNNPDHKYSNIVIITHGSNQQIEVFDSHESTYYPERIEMIAIPTSVTNTDQQKYRKEVLQKPPEYKSYGMLTFVELQKGRSIYGDADFENRQIEALKSISNRLTSSGSILLGGCNLGSPHSKIGNHNIGAYLFFNQGEDRTLYISNDLNGTRTRITTNSSEDNKLVRPIIGSALTHDNVGSPQGFVQVVGGSSNPKESSTNSSIKITNNGFSKTPTNTQRESLNLRERSKNKNL